MYHGLQGSMGTLDHVNPTRLSKRHQMSPYIHCWNWLPTYTTLQVAVLLLLHLSCVLPEHSMIT